MTWDGLSLLVATVAAVVSAIYEALGYHRRRGDAVSKATQSRAQRPIWISLAFVLIAWAAVGVDVYDRHYWRAGREPAIVEEWGTTTGFGFYMDVNSALLSEFKAEHKMYLVVHANYSDIDRMTDTAIAKSAPYTITANRIKMSINDLRQLRINYNTMVLVEYDLVVLPAKISIDKIANLTDIVTLGGRIIAERMKGDYFLSVPISPPVASPPSPGPPASPTGMSPQLSPG